MGKRRFLEQEATEAAEADGREGRNQNDEEMTEAGNQNGLKRRADVSRHA